MRPRRSAVYHEVPDVSEMDPWKDDRCRDFVALNTIQRLRAYHLAPGLPMPPIEPVHAVRAKNLLLLPRATPDYRPCMGELPSATPRLSFSSSNEETPPPRPSSSTIKKEKEVSERTRRMENARKAQGKWKEREKTEESTKAEEEEELKEGQKETQEEHTEDGPKDPTPLGKHFSTPFLLAALPSSFHASTPSNDRPPACDGGGGHDAAGAASSLSSSSSTPRPPRSWSGPSIHTHSTTECALHLARQVFFGLNAFPPSSSPSSTPVSRPTGTMMSDGAPKSLPLPSPSSSPFIVYPTHLHSPPPPISTPFPGSSDKVERSGGGKVDPHADACSACGERGEHSHSSGVCPSPLSSSPPPLLVQKEINKEAIKEEVKKSELEGAISPSSSNTPLRGGGMAPLSTSPRMVVDNDGLLHSTPLRVSPLDALSTDLSPSIHLPVSSFAISSGDRLPCLDAVAGPSFPFPDPEEKSELGEEVGKEKLGRSAALFFPPSSTTQEAKVEKGRHPTSWVTPSVNRGREDQGQQEDNGDSLYTSHRDGPFHMMTLPYCGLSSSGEEVESNVERCSPLPLSFCPCSASPSASSAIIPKSEGEGGNMTKDVSIRTACGAYLDGKEENELRYTPSLPATALHSSSATSYPLSPAPRPSLLVLSDLQKEDSIDKALAQGRRGRGGISGKDSGGHGGTPPTPLCIPPLPRFSGEVDINLPSLPLPNAEEERKVEGEGEPLASSSSAQVSMENTPLPHRPPSALPAAVAATTTASTSTGVMMVSSECSCDAVVHSLVAYYQSLLTRGVVLDRFNHKELAFAWWVIGRNMDRQALETPGTARREALLITLRDFYYSQLSSKRRSSSALVGGGSGVEEQLQAATRENESHLPSPPTSSSAARAESFIRKISTEALPGSGNEGKGGGGRRREKDTTLSSTPSLVPARGSSDTSPSLEHYSGSSSKKEDERLSHASLFPIRIHGGRERGKGKEGTGKRVKKSTRVKGKAGAATWEMMESEMEEEEEVEEDGTLPQQEESPASKLRSSRGRGRRRQREEEQDHKEGREGEEKEEEEAEGGGGEKKRKKNKDLESEEDREVGEKEEEELQDGGPHSSSLPASTTTRTNTKKKSRKSEEVQRQHQQGEEKVEMSGKKKGRLRRPREEEDEEEEEKKEKKGKGDVAQQEREVNASTCSPSPSSSSRRKKRMTQEEKRKAIEELWLPSSSRSNRSARTQERLQALEALLRDKTEEQHSSSAALPSSSLVLGSSHLPPSLPVQDGGGRRAGTGFVTSSSSTSSSCSAPSFHHDPEKIKKSPKKQRDIETPLHPSSTTTSSSRSVVVGGDGKEIDRRAGQQKMEPDENEKEGERGRGEISSQSDASSSNMKEKKENKTIEEPHHTSISKKKIHPHGEDKKKKKEEGVEVVGVEEEKNDKVTLKKGREGIESFASTSLATAVAGDRGEGGQRGECQSGGGVLLSSLATALPTNNLTRDTQASKGEEWKKTRKGRKRTHSDVLISSLPPCESSTSHLSAVEEAFCILSSSVLGSPSPSPASESFPLNHFQQRIQERLRFRLLGGGGGIRTTSCSSSPCRCRRCCPPPTSPSPCEKDSAAFSPTPAVPRPAPARVVAASLPTPPSPLSLEDYLTKGGYPSHLVSSYRYLLLSSHHLTDRDVGDREWSGFPSEAWAVGGGAGLHLDTSSSTGRGMKKNSHSSRNHTKKEDEEEEDVDGAEMSHVKRRKCQPLQLTAVTSTSNNCNSIREGKEDPIPAYYRSHVPPLRSIQVDMEAEYGGVDPVLLTNSFYRHNQKDWESYMHRTLCEALEGKKVQEKNDHVKEKVVEKGSSGVQPVGHLPSEKGSTARMPEDERGKNGWLLLVPSDNSPPLTNHLSHAPSPPASTDKAIPCESSFELKKVEQHQLGCSSDDNGTDEEKTRIAFDNAAETLIHDLTDDEGKKEMRNEKKGNVAAPPSTEAAPTSSNRTTSLPCDIHSLPYAQQCLLVWEAACLLDPPSKPRSSAPHGGEQQESSAISDNGGKMGEPLRPSPNDRRPLLLSKGATVIDYWSEYL